MIGYQYDDDFRLIGPVPLASNPRNYGEYLIPANCTTVVPPAGYGEEVEPAFNEGSQTWELVKSRYQIELELSYAEAYSPTGAPLYEQDIDGNWIARDPADIQAEDDANNAAILYEEQMRDARELMDESIINEALNVTKGTTVASAQSFLQAFQIRAANPAEYVNDGLIVRYAIDNYSVNGALDTEQKIQDYYTKVLIYMDKFREQKISEYIATVSALTPP